MNSNPKLSYAIAAILSTCAAASLTNRASAAATDTEANSEAIQEVTVTAQRRSENAQNVPITIQTLSGDLQAIS